MASKQEIKEWLEECKPGCWVTVAYCFGDLNGRCVAASFSDLDVAAQHLALRDHIPLHILNTPLTGIQGPTFAEWKKQKGREGKVEKVIDVLQRTSRADYKDRANKILDAIEGDENE